MTLEEFYNRIGGDYRATLARIPSEALVKKFVLKYPSDRSCSELEESLKAGDWKTAFRASHTLKGVAQNLGFERLYQASAALTDAVRDGAELTEPALWTAVETAHRDVIGAIEALQD